MRTVAIHDAPRLLIALKAGEFAPTLSGYQKFGNELKMIVLENSQFLVPAINDSRPAGTASTLRHGNYPIFREVAIQHVPKFIPKSDAWQNVWFVQSLRISFTSPKFGHIPSFESTSEHSKRILDDLVLKTDQVLSQWDTWLSWENRECSQMFDVRKIF